MVMDMTTQDMLGIHYRWVKKGRIIDKHYLGDELNNKWLKIELTANNHSRILSNNILVTFVIDYGTNQQEEPSNILDYI